MILPDHYREIIELLTTESTELDTSSAFEFLEWVEQEEFAQVKIKEPKKKIPSARVSIKTLLFSQRTVKAVFHGGAAEAEETLRRFDVNQQKP